jgi:hypothetical protein
MQSYTRGKQQQLENSMYPANNKEAGRFEQLAKMPSAMFSGRLLKLINKAIHDMLSRLGAQSLLSVGHYGTGAFTVLDQMAEILARYAQASHKQAKEVAGMLNAIMAYLGAQPTPWPMPRWPPFAGYSTCCTSRSTPWPNRPFNWWGGNANRVSPAMLKSQWQVSRPVGRWLDIPGGQ